MKQRWKQFALRIDALSLRERAMIFAAVVAVVIYIVNSLVLDRFMSEDKRLSKQLAQDRSAISTMRAEIRRRAAEHPVDPDAENKAILQKLQEQVAQADERMRNMQNGLVSPDKMASLLEGLLNRNPKLHLVSFKTLPVASLNDAFASKPDDKGNSAAAVNDAAVRQNAGAEALYKHGVEIAVQGTYFDIMQYMTQLEGMPWQLVWGKAKLHVDEYPKATLTLELYTLSMEKKWLNI